MIKITFKVNSKSNLIEEFTASGHANYSKNNELDLVCACVSSIVIGGLNNIKDIKNYLIKINSGFVNVATKLPNEHDNNVIETIITQIETLKNNYPKNISIERKVDKI